MKLTEVQQVFAKMLLREQVSIRSIGADLGKTLGEFAGRTKDPILLTEYVRHRLARAICTRYRGKDGRLHAVTLDPALEDRIRAGLEHNERGLFVRIVAGRCRNNLPLDRRRDRKTNQRRSAGDRAGEPADSPGAQANDLWQPAAFGGAELQRNYPRHAHRSRGGGNRR